MSVRFRTFLSLFYPSAVGNCQHATIALSQQISMVHTIACSYPQSFNLMRLVGGFYKQEVPFLRVFMWYVEVAQTLLVGVEDAVTQFVAGISLDAQMYGFDAVVLADDSSVGTVAWR